jgi:hypothetical protein
VIGDHEKRHSGHQLYSRRPYSEDGLHSLDHLGLRCWRILALSGFWGILRIYREGSTAVYAYDGFSVLSMVGVIKTSGALLWPLSEKVHGSEIRQRWRYCSLLFACFVLVLQIKFYFD